MAVEHRTPVAHTFEGLCEAAAIHQQREGQPPGMGDVGAVQVCGRQHQLRVGMPLERLPLVQPVGQVLPQLRQTHQQATVAAGEDAIKACMPFAFEIGVGVAVSDQASEPEECKEIGVAAAAAHHQLAALNGVFEGIQIGLAGLPAHGHQQGMGQFSRVGLGFTHQLRQILSGSP